MARIYTEAQVVALLQQMKDAYEELRRLECEYAELVSENKQRIIEALRRNGLA